MNKKNWKQIAFLGAGLTVLVLGFQNCERQSSDDFLTQINSSETLAANAQQECGPDAILEPTVSDNGVHYGWMNGDPGYSCYVGEQSGTPKEIPLCGSTAVGSEEDESGKKYGWIPNENGDGGESCIYANSCIEDNRELEHGETFERDRCRNLGGSRSLERVFSTYRCSNGEVLYAGQRIVRDPSCDRN